MRKVEGARVVGVFWQFQDYGVRTGGKPERGGGVAVEFPVDIDLSGVGIRRDGENPEAGSRRGRGRGGGRRGWRRLRG